MAGKADKKKKRLQHEYYKKNIRKYKAGGKYYQYPKREGILEVGDDVKLCLRCGRKFMIKSKHNRICEPCQRANEGVSAREYAVLGRKGRSSNYNEGVYEKIYNV